MPESDEDKRERIDHLRRELMQANVSYTSMSAAAGELVFAEQEIPWLREAYMGTVMAANYCYTLAAVLKAVEKIASLDVALELAGEMEEILTNGDFANWNEDITETGATDAGL